MRNSRTMISAISGHRSNAEPHIGRDETVIPADARQVLMLVKKRRPLWPPFSLCSRPSPSRASAKAEVDLAKAHGPETQRGVAWNGGGHKNFLNIFNECINAHYSIKIYIN